MMSQRKVRLQRAPVVHQDGVKYVNLLSLIYTPVLIEEPRSLDLVGSMTCRALSGGNMLHLQ